ncbi:glutamate-5-semialdehyde dehydrogenase [Candidatus Epulonipiscium viviparus]|uniref:glutamate-5-semialdehyde dehydrogenase n=1 Tax=Candidatus Epulonipiscium viviparus TaxID=420336 RepID=UPI00016C0605|nr:glutamate-5-semialdehyde dehydrogenase [Candidatus Epulopiscium viviparus]
MEVRQKGEKLKKAKHELGLLNTSQKNHALLEIKNSLLKNKRIILNANKIDITNAVEAGISKALIDRLTLTENRLIQIADSIDTIIKLTDPTGVIMSGKILENGMQLIKKTVPLGTIAIIYEARPNVTIDATVLAIKSGNAILLRGSSSTINSNKAIVAAIKEGLRKSDVTEDSCFLIENTKREVVKEIVTANEFIDLVIPRGGAELIKMVIKTATVPTIETGVGNCHMYVDSGADLDMAYAILNNGKMSRPSVCNSLETLLVHQDVAEEFLKMAYNKLGAKLEFRGCKKTCEIIPAIPATIEDFEQEFLDYIIAVRVVDSIDEAIEHITEFSSGHSECIITNNLLASNKFIKEIDSACVYVNASTRFSDGGEFGFGAEMGISTQKIHARGPFSINELISYKYIITGDGQVRQ